MLLAGSKKYKNSSLLPSQTFWAGQPTVKYQLTLFPSSTYTQPGTLQLTTLQRHATSASLLSTLKSHRPTAQTSQKHLPSANIAIMCTEVTTTCQQSGCNNTASRGTEQKKCTKAESEGLEFGACGTGIERVTKEGTSGTYDDYCRDHFK